MKLMLWFLVVFIVAQAALTSLAFVYRQRADAEYRDAQLIKWLRKMSDRLEIAGPPWTEGYLEHAIPSMADYQFVAVATETGELVLQFGELVDRNWVRSVTVGIAEQRIGSPLLQTLPEEETGQFKAGELRIASMPFTASDGLFYLHTAANASLLKSLPVSAWDYFSIIGPISILAAGVAGWWLAGKATQPIRALTRAAENMTRDADLSPERLTGRLHVDAHAQEIDRLQAELNKVLRRLENAYGAQEQFIGNVAHELKTPISVLLTEAQLLRKDSVSHEEVRSFVHSVEEEMGALGRLIESFLVLTRADQGESLARQTDAEINDVVLDSVRHCQDFAEQHEVRLIPNFVLPDDCDFDPIVRGDPDLLRTMVDNIIRNAVRFSPAKGQVEIDVDCNADRAEIRIRDHGPGIPEEHLSTIFERFSRAPAAVNRSGGSGLGLGIAESIARLHNGTIVGRNHPEGGCEFIIELPMFTRMETEAPVAAE